MRVRKYVVRTRLLALRNPRVSTAVQAALRVAAKAPQPEPVAQVRRIEKKRSGTP